MKRNYDELEKKMQLAESKSKGNGILKMNKLKSYFSLRKVNVKIIKIKHIYIYNDTLYLLIFNCIIYIYINIKSDEDNQAIKNFATQNADTTAVSDDTIISVSRAFNFK